MARRAGGAAVILVAVGFAACGANEDASRDWSGRYGARVVEATTDCSGGDEPSPMTGLVLDVSQRADTVTVTLNPIVRLEGRIQDGHLEARTVIEAPVALPDSLASRVSAADSLETITYLLEADFTADGFTGSYLIRSPDLRAVFQGAGGRCDLRYELAGQRLPDAVSPGGSPPASS